jgi:two-component system, LuxR family, sensor kinase FixL
MKPAVCAQVPRTVASGAEVGGNTYHADHGNHVDIRRTAPWQASQRALIGDRKMDWRIPWRDWWLHHELAATNLSSSLPAYMLTGGAYLALYLALESITLVHPFDTLGITLWGPSRAVSLVLLLTKGFAYSPFLFVAALLSDLLIYREAQELFVMLPADGVLALGYTGLAALLKFGCRFDLKRASVRDVVVLLVVIPGATLILAVAYAGLFVALDGLLPAKYWAAVRHIWIGETVGVVVVLPAIMAVLLTIGRSESFNLVVHPLDIGLFLIGLAVAFFLIFGLAVTNDFQFFYLLFLPIIAIALRLGFAGAAFGLLLTHLILSSITTLAAYRTADFMVFQMLMLALSATGLLLGMVVTERRRADERVRKQQLELARMARYTTAGAMGVALAHQISQPLTTVATYLHVGRGLLKGGQASSDAFLELFEKAEGEVRRAKDVLERLREFLSHGHADVRLLDTVEVARRIVALSQDDAKTRGVAVRLDATDAPSITADPVHIEQVLLNLVNNAVDAAAERTDGRAMVTVRVRGRDGLLTVEVEDNGPGIAPDMAGRLFEPFETSKPRGMGLGLPLSRQIIEAHGGQLRWRNIEPQGARFSFELQSRPTHAS